MPQGRYSCARRRPPALGTNQAGRLRRRVIPLDNRGIDWKGVRVFPEARLCENGRLDSSSEQSGYNSAARPQILWMSAKGLSTLEVLLLKSVEFLV